MKHFDQCYHSQDQNAPSKTDSTVQYQGQQDSIGDDFFILSSLSDDGDGGGDQSRGNNM